MTENDIVGWHHWLDKHEFEKASVVGDGQAVLVCCSPKVQKESEMTEWLNWSELNTSIKCLLKILHGFRNISKCNKEECLAFHCLLLMWLITLWLFQLSLKLIAFQLFDALYLVLPLITMKLTANTPLCIILSLTVSTQQWIKVMKTEEGSK